MKKLLLVCLVLVACSSQRPVALRQGEVAPGLQGQPVYVVPFETLMVPTEVADNLFNHFVDRLNQRGAASRYEFIILKQALAEVDPAWLGQRNYLRGELFAYVEDIGGTVTDIKARSRLRLFQPGDAAPSLQISYPAERFFENDYSSLAAERQTLAEEIADQLADQLLNALSGQP